MSGKVESKPESSHSSGKVVRITKTHQLKKQTVQVINERAIKSVFGRDDVKDCPVAIYSIAGELRKGKSFFLNLMMRYLEFREWNKQSEWRNNTEAVLNRSFEWRGGTQRHTEGILVWNKPFFINTDQDKKIAVFLIDSQGLFDKQSSPYSDSVMLSLVAFLSSCQIYNIKDKISFAHLEHLQVYADYGKQVYGRDLAQSYQTLMFLMRDWQEIDYDFGFEGGKKYIDEVLATAGEESLEYKILCQNIKKTFKEVKCALLPDPGKKIRLQKKEAQCACIKDIDDDFLEVLEKIFEVMFGKIEVTQLGDLSATGEDIVNLAITLSNKVKQNEFGPDAFIEAFSAATLKKLIGECEDKFHEKILDLGKTNIFNQEELENHHKIIVDETMKHFEENHKTGLNPMVAKCASDFEKTLAQKKFFLDNANELTKIGIMELYQALTQDCLDACKQVFETKYSKLLTEKKYVTDADLTTEFNHVEQNTLSMFKEVYNGFEMDDDICEKFEAVLRENLKLLRRVFSEENEFSQIEVHLEAQRGALWAAKNFFSQATKIDLVKCI